MKSISSIELQLLIDNHWSVEIKSKIVCSAKNDKTGCHITGKMAHDFILEKLEELKEDDAPQVSFAERITMIESLGYSVESESPLAMTDPDGAKSSGECAIFILMSLTS